MAMLAPPGLSRLTPAQGGARAMRIVATGMLVAMAALFALAHWQQAAHPAWPYVKAFAEAAMVGGLADWFAVTALFRHPLGLPIPHTAIIPRNKDRIGDTLAAFLRDNFLTPSVVARRMRRMDLAGAAGRFLSAPPARGRLWRGASRLVEGVLEALDPDRFGPMVKGALADRLRAFDAAPAIGRALEASIAGDRHIALLDEVIVWIARITDANEPVIRRMVHERSPSLLRWTGLDENLANRIIDALRRLLSDLAVDPDHELRRRIEEALADLARRMQSDPALKARVHAMKADLLDNPALESWWMGMWERMRGGLLRTVRDPDSAMAGHLAAMLGQLGETLERDPRLRTGINRFARRAAVGVAADYGDDLVRLVSDTVRGWDARTITNRLEGAVGRDLQYIRINGTIVGGLVGLLIHIAETAG